MRYCRDGLWSACEGIRSYAALPPSSGVNVKYLGLINRDAGACDDPCAADCWKAVDPLDQLDGGVGTNVVANTGGGITVVGELIDGGVVKAPDDIDPEPPCDPVTDGDCDGIPDHLDPDPSQKQFGSDKSTIFFDLAPGETKSTTFDIEFALKNADIYFLLDMSSSMEEEKNNLISSLQTGNFLNDPDTPANEANIDCADRDFTGGPDNYLKNQGITGNIACLIRGAQFGVGFFRELPFSSGTSATWRYGWPNHEVYEHRQDINPSVPLTASALNLLFPGYYNQNWAESSGLALYATATGDPLYFGWDRPGVPAKTCPEGRFGYPCFRSEAMPIIVLITDAPVMNGPTPSSQSHLGEIFPGISGNQTVNYDARGLRHMQVSTTHPDYTPVEGNESFATAHDVGTIDNIFRTYTGDTRGMAADIHAGNLGIPTTSDWPSNATSANSRGYPDAVFRFRVVDPNKTLTISTRGTRFKPTLAVVRASAPVSGWLEYDNTPYPSYSDDPGCNGTVRRNECTSSLGGAEIKRKFPAGEYYAVIKGRAANTSGAPGSSGTPAADVGRGWYQITFGDSNRVSDQTYVPPTWGLTGANCTGGICKALLDNKIRVITIASTIGCSGCDGGEARSNKALQEQGDSMAKLTGAKNLAGSALRFDISNNGSGMGNRVVQSIYQLSQGLKQDISVRFVPQPDTPTAPQAFTFLSRAISTPGDGCDGVADREPAGALDGIPDTHTSCAPGALPRFQIRIGNPPYTSPKRVLPNTAPGSKGGYNMRIDLVGNGQYVIDSTPVFVVPEDVVYEPSKYTYQAQGVYTQDVASNPCTGTARPTWGSLTWSASIPKDTSIEWRLCAGDSTAELDACAAATNPSQWRSVSTVTSGASCTQSSQCPMPGARSGYCAGNVCEYSVLAGAACTADADCGGGRTCSAGSCSCLADGDCGPGGTCSAGSCNWCSADADCGSDGTCNAGKCSWKKNPIDLRPVAKRSLDGYSMLRVQVRLNASPDRLSAPTLYDYSVNYFCSPYL